MKLVKVTLLIASGLFLAAGTSGTEVTQTQADQFQKGVATVSDVEGKLGPPQATSTMGNGDTAVDYIEMQVEAVPASGVLGTQLVTGGIDVRQVRAEFEFDKSGHLVGETTSKHHKECFNKWPQLYCPAHTTPLQPAHGRAMCCQPESS